MHAVGWIIFHNCDTQTANNSNILWNLLLTSFQAVFCSPAQPDQTPGHLTKVNCLLQTHRAQSELALFPQSSTMPNNPCPEQMVPGPQTHVHYRLCSELALNTGNNLELPESEHQVTHLGQGHKVGISVEKAVTRTSARLASIHLTVLTHCQTQPLTTLMVITAPAALNSPSHTHPSPSIFLGQDTSYENVFSFFHFKNEKIVRILKRGEYTVTQKKHDNFFCICIPFIRLQISSHVAEYTSNYHFCKMIEYRFCWSYTT